MLDPDGGERPETNCKQVERKRGAGVEKISLPLSLGGWLSAVLKAASGLDVLVSLPATLVSSSDAVAVLAVRAGRDSASICGPRCSYPVTGAAENWSIWQQILDESARIPISTTVRKR